MESINFIYIFLLVIGLIIAVLVIDYWWVEFYNKFKGRIILLKLAFFMYRMSLKYDGDTKKDLIKMANNSLKSALWIT